MQELLNAINRLNAVLETNEAIQDLKDMCEILEGLIPGFVSPFPDQGEAA